MGALGVMALALWPVTMTFVAVTALPLAGLLLLSTPRGGRELGVLGAALAVAVLWLAAPAELPGRVFKASALVASASFLVMTVVTRLRTAHRVLAAVGVAQVAVTGLVLVFGASWAEVSWWVQHRLGLAARKVIGALWAGGGEGPLMRAGDAEQLEAWLASTVTLAGEMYPAMVALMVSAGLVAATAMYWRVAQEPRGRQLGQMTEFRFSEHLGWGVVAALAVVLIPKLVVAKTAALNVLVVAAAFYGLRGVAIGVFFLEAVGGGGILLSLLLAVIMFLMLPVVIGSAILLGVLDTGMDLRTRWRRTPRTGS